MKNNFISTHQTRISDYLVSVLPSLKTEPLKLHQAIHYSVLNGGKRLRPLLVYAVGETFQTDKSLLDPIAASVEMIHCYSLIHDDLPAMDNDDLRRGLPTCHKAFDEATAILAGDALQALAFEVLTQHLQTKLPADILIKMVLQLSQACGSFGMAGGQALDMAATRQALSVEYVEEMHAKKTGALIKASIDLAAMASQASSTDLKVLAQYGDAMGLAFQIQDDILDVDDATEVDKLTYPGAVGLEAAKVKRDELYQTALEGLKDLSCEAALLEYMASFMLGQNLT